LAEDEEEISETLAESLSNGRRQEKIVPATRDSQPRANELQGFVERCERFFTQAVANLPRENRELAERLEDVSVDSDTPAESYSARCEEMSAAAMRLALLINTSAEEPILRDSEQDWASILAFIAMDSLPWPHQRAAIFDSLQLRRVLAEVFQAFGLEGEDRWRAAANIRVLLWQGDAPRLRTIYSREFWNDGDVRWLAGVNESSGVTYVNKEMFEDLVDWLQLPTLLQSARREKVDMEEVERIRRQAQWAREAASKSGYKLDLFLKSEPDSGPKMTKSESNDRTEPLRIRT